MTRPTRALLLGSVLLAAPAALADSLDTPHVVDKVTITGSRSVPTEKLTAVLQEHAGSSVTQSDIAADRDAIMKVLGQANVGGRVAARITEEPKHKHLTVEFIVVDEGIQKPAVTHVAAKLHTELFSGNAAISSEKLTAAAGLQPGQTLSNEAVQAAQKAIVAAYAAAKLPLNVNVSGDIQQTPDGKVDLTWKIVETKAKKKRNTEDDREQFEQ